MNIPQPTPQQDQVITAIFAVLSMAVNALGFVPGLDPKVRMIALTAVTDLENAYATFKANPANDVYAQIEVILNQALADIKALTP